MTNLQRFLYEIGMGITEQAEALEAKGSETETEALALRDYASQLWAVSEHSDDRERINWAELVDRIGVEVFG